MADIENIKKLRSLSGAGFKDCNLALDESKGDLEKAIEILRVKGISKASKKMTRTANEGVIAITENEQRSSILEINCETDFVAKNEDFISFVKELSIINDSNSSDLNKLKNSKMKNNKSVDENLVDLISKIGEKITIGRAKTINNQDGKNYTYLHTVVKDNLSKLAVVVSLNTKSSDEKIDLFGKQLSMHVAASNPLALNQNDIDESLLNKEKELIGEELKNTGKPSEIVEKISIGKLNKFKSDNSLMTQDWVMDPKKKVNDILKELAVSDLSIKEFYRIKIGE